MAENSIHEADGTAQAPEQDDATLIAEILAAVDTASITQENGFCLKCGLVLLADPATESYCDTCDRELEAAYEAHLAEEEEMEQERLDAAEQERYADVDDTAAYWNGRGY